MHLNKIPQNKNYFIIYSPLSCWISIFCWTEEDILKNVGNQAADGKQYIGGQLGAINWQKYSSL